MSNTSNATSSNKSDYPSAYERLAKNVFSRFGFLVLLAVISVLFFLSNIITTTYEERTQGNIPFEISYSDDESIELFESSIEVEGKIGTKTTVTSYELSLFDSIFRKDRAKIINSRVETQDLPVEQIVKQGTRKWQYMMCSDGSYRYYTDEQFSDRFTGFTSSSKDYCAENNQGTKLRLADEPDGSVSASAPTYTSSNCEITDIPYQTVFEDVSWLPEGQTQQAYGGVDGFKYECSDGVGNYTYDPFNEVVYVGTGDIAPSYTPPSYDLEPVLEGPDYAVKKTCDADYSYAKSQISLAGASNSSAMQQLESAYRQCLRAAGF